MVANDPTRALYGAAATVMVQASAEAEASVVVAVEVDGKALSPEALSGLEQHSLEGIGRVEIQRRPTRVVARSVLRQGADYCGQVDAAIDQSAFKQEVQRVIHVKGPSE